MEFPPDACFLDNKNLNNYNLKRLNLDCNVRKMERILDYEITEEYEGLKISQFLTRQGFSLQNMTLLKKMPENTMLNGKFVHLKETVTRGDHLRIHIREQESSKKIPPVKLPLDIIYEDQDILVINKPAGMPIHPSQNNYENSMANALAWYFKEKGQAFVFRCANRLDRDTSGLTIVSKHMLSGNRISTMTANRQIHREYLAISRGSINPKEGVIAAPLGRKGTSIIEREVNFQTGERALTHYQLVEERNGHSLVRLVLETGRTHQIRVHLKYLGFPLVGDYLYNPDMEYINRQALHAYRLTFIHPVTGENMEFTVPLPEDMRRILYP